MENKLNNFSNYLINSTGTVYNLKRKLFVNIEDNNGYKYVRITNDNGQRIKWYLHRLIATVFLKNNNPSFNEIDHIDCNKSNNNVNNLKWCNRKINMNNPITKQRFHSFVTTKYGIL